MPKDKAFGKYVNSACQKAGQKLLKEAKAEKQKKVDYGKKEIYQSAKEAATYMRNKARGKVTLYSTSSYCCFECRNRLKGPCRFCMNGSKFEPVKKEVTSGT